MNNETKMKKIVIKCHTGYCGMDSYEFIEVPVSMTQEELDRLAWGYALDNAERFGIYPPEDSEDEDEGTFNASGYSGDNIEGVPMDYDSKLHDRYSRTGSPEFQFNN